jgi:hypothetical protein
MSRYTTKEIDFIKNNLDKGNLELSELMGRSYDGIRSVLSRLDINRTEDQREELRRLNLANFYPTTKNNVYKKDVYLCKLRFAKTLGYKNMSDAFDGETKQGFEKRYKATLN